jgi:hypothetical protein
MKMPTNLNIKAVLQRAALSFREKHGQVQVYNEGFVNEIVEQTAIECAKLVDYANENDVPLNGTCVKQHFGVE